jgi:hypothetical protein
MEPLMATATLRLGPTDHGRTMTPKEYLDVEVERGDVLLSGNAAARFGDFFGRSPVESSDSRVITA